MKRASIPYERYRNMTIWNRVRTLKNKIIDAHEKSVYYDQKLRKIIKVIRNGTNPLFILYQHRIAELLFPKIILTYDLAIERTKVGDKTLNPMLQSKEIETSPEHKAFVKYYYKYADRQSASYMMNFGPPLVRKHLLKFISNKQLNELEHKMIEMGVNANFHPANVDFINGKPFFFEVEINSLLLAKRLDTIENEKTREKVRLLLERLKFRKFY